MLELRALGLRLAPSIAEMAALAGVTRIEPFAAEHRALLAGRSHLLLQAKSTGHGREWPLDHVLALARMLPPERFQIISAAPRLRAI